MKKICAIIVLMIVFVALPIWAENMVITLEKKANIKQGDVIYNTGTTSLHLPDPQTGDKVKIDNVRFVNLTVKGSGLNCRSTYLYYTINDKEIKKGNNFYEALNLPIPFAGQDLTPAMRKGNISLARQMLRNRKYELLNLCILYQGYKAVGEQESSQAKDIAENIQAQIKDIHQQYGQESLVEESVLTYAGLK